MKQKILLLDRFLKKKFGTPHRSKELPDPVNLLIATILSQNTNDRNSFKAYNNLKEKYKAWEEVSKLRTTQIEKLIKVAGLGKQKSKAIKYLLSALLKEKGRVTLEHLRKMKNDAVLTELTSYPGIGIKTASCVLLFSLNRNVCPVDTHVHRTLNRIGLVKTNSPDKTFLLINKDLPEGIAHSFHTNLIRLGREVCKPAKPDCQSCPVLNICRFESKSIHNEYFYKNKSFMLLDNI
jgi:endonuclease III